MPSKRPGWSADTPQERGRRAEKKSIKERGGRLHPGSGSGRIRFDGSTEGYLIEVKDAAATHVLSSAYIDRLYREATRQGKDVLYVVSFPDYELEITVRKK